MRFSRPLHSFSRSTYFCTFPVEVLGKSPNSTASGHLKCARRSRQKAMISCSVTLCPGFKETNALGRSPHVSSGMATTAHSRTAACWTMTCSTSECCGSRVRVLVVAFHHVIAAHHDLTHRFTVLGDVVHCLIDDAQGISNGVALALPGEQACLFSKGKGIPFGMPLQKKHNYKTSLLLS